MKKIISLLASVAMLATMVTSVSAATLATNNPVVSTTIEEMDAAAFEEFTYEALEDGNKAYLVTVDFTGLDLSNERGSDADGNGTLSAAEKGKRTGVLLSAAQYNIIWDSEDNIIGIYDEDRTVVEPAGFLDQTGTALGIANYTTVATMLPTTKNTATAPVTATEMRATSFVVLTDGTPVTGTVEASLVLRQKENSVRVGIANYDMSNLGAEVNGVETTKVTLGENKPAEPITITKEYGDVGEGFAWDVEVNNYDAEKTYTATFTSGTEKKVNDFDFSKYIEAGGSTTKFSFVTLLKTLKENVQLVVSAN